MLGQGFVSTIARRLVAVAVVAMVAAPATVMTTAAQDAEEVVIALAEVGESGVTGEAILTPSGEQTLVTIDVEGAAGPLPANILEGFCDDFDPNPAFPLADVDAEGLSETTVSAPLADLLAGEFAIVLNQSPTELGTVVACGDIAALAVGGTDVVVETADVAAPAPAVGAADAAVGAAAAPATGIGIAADRGGAALMTGLAALAAVLLVGGVAFRRWEGRA